MKTRWLLWNAALLAALGALPQAAGAQAQAQAQALAGSWTLDAGRSQDPIEALAAARGGGGAMMRGGSAGGGGGGAVMRGGGAGGGGGAVVMRGAGAGTVDIGAMLQSGQRLTIELAADAVTLHVDDQPPLTLTLGGAETEVTRWGRQVRARASLENGTLTLDTTVEGGISLREVFTPGEGRELGAELHFVTPGPGGAQAPPVLIQRVYTAAREVGR